MKPVITLTLNPAIDTACEADTIRPIRKIRTTNETYDPGGGGINVARVIVELGGEALAIYLAGGVSGAVLDSLVDERGVPAPSHLDSRSHTHELGSDRKIDRA